MDIHDKVERLKSKLNVLSEKDIKSQNALRLSQELDKLIAVIQKKYINS